MAPDGSAGDRFAYDVAIDGGGSALIGAYGAGPLDVFNGNNGMVHTLRRCLTGAPCQTRVRATGAVYLYRLSAPADTPFGQEGSSWLIDNKLFASDGAPNDRFGWAVAVSQSDDGDGTVTVIVGARGDDNAGSNSGSAYVMDVPPPYNIYCFTYTLSYMLNGSGHAKRLQCGPTTPASNGAPAIDRLRQVLFVRRLLQVLGPK